MDDDAFLAYVGERLGELPAVEAVTLGGSRAEGTHRPDSDWDFSVYYRGHFDPQALRDTGWPGEVFEVGGWSKGVFNGGAWLEIDGRRVDVHYRDLAVIEHELSEAREGRFHIEPLMFHLAGIPSYLIVAELAINRVLRGDMPRPDFPPLLRELAPTVWMDRARMTLGYARTAYVKGGLVTEMAGAIAAAAAMTGHAVLAARGEWITNEKRLLERAGLRFIDELVMGLRAEAASLDSSINQAAQHFKDALAEATR